MILAYRKNPDLRGQASACKDLKALIFFDMYVMQLQVKNSDQVTIIGIVGEIDWTTSEEIQAQFGEQIHEGSKIVLDLSQVECMSSAGFRMLLSMYREIQARHGHLVLVKLSEQIQDLMAITGFLKYFPILPSVEDGVSALQQVNSQEGGGHEAHRRVSDPPL